MQLNANFEQRVVMPPATPADWVPSPMGGVHRRLLDRVGDEVARATSLVRYAPGSRFSRHEHGGGEEILVLEGVFSDEHGDFAAGSYLRNPPGSGHAPFSREGCTLFVKLWQFARADIRTVRIDTRTAEWHAGLVPGLSVMPLHEFDGVSTALVRWAPNTLFSGHSHPGGGDLRSRWPVSRRAWRVSGRLMAPKPALEPTCAVYGLGRCAHLRQGRAPRCRPARAAVRLAGVRADRAGATVNEVSRNQPNTRNTSGIQKPPSKPMPAAPAARRFAGTISGGHHVVQVLSPCHTRFDRCRSGAQCRRTVHVARLGPLEGRPGQRNFSGIHPHGCAGLGRGPCQGLHRSEGQGDLSKWRDEEFPLSFHELHNTLTTINGVTVGDLYDQYGNVLLDPAGNPQRSEAPDGNSLIEVPGAKSDDPSKRRLFMVTHQEYDWIDTLGNDNYGRMPMTMNLATIDQDKKTGALTTVAMKNIDFPASAACGYPVRARCRPGTRTSAARNTSRTRAALKTRVVSAPVPRASRPGTTLQTRRTWVRSTCTSTRAA